tara:strand:+ start:74 stop:988 length:915 start_codon:yes stop_codon:yes gene_type:complete
MAKKWNPAYQKGKSSAGTPGKVSIAWYDYHDNEYAYTDRQTPHFLSFQKLANQELVDDSRDWKTKYYSDKGFVHNLRHGLNMSKDGRYFTGHSRTGWIDDDGDMRPNSYYWAGKQWEILDFDAYNRDAVYKSALQKRYGSNKKFATPQDILDAEEVMSGTWQKEPTPKPAPPKPAPPPKPQQLDLSQYLSKDQVKNLQQTWEKKAQSEFANTLAQAQATWDSRISDLQSGWDVTAGQLKAYQEQAAIDAERARVQASYGNIGGPTNPAVQGVRTQDKLLTRPRSTGGFFGREGNRIKNTSLNIA